jgi:hypothetical protein
VLLHFFHFLLNSGVQFVFETQRLHVIHVAIAVEQVTLKGCPRLFLSVACSAGFVFIVAVTVVPLPIKNSARLFSCKI